MEMVVTPHTVATDNMQWNSEWSLHVKIWSTQIILISCHLKGSCNNYCSWVHSYIHVRNYMLHANTYIRQLWEKSN